MTFGGLIPLLFGGPTTAGPAQAVWMAPVGGGPAGLDAGVVYKAAGDVIDLGFDFGNFPAATGSGNAITAQSLTVASVVGSADVLVSALTAVGSYQLVARFAGGTAGTDYPVTASVTWANGMQITRTGTLKVQ